MLRILETLPWQRVDPFVLSFSIEFCFHDGVCGIGQIPKTLLFRFESLPKSNPFTRCPRICRENSNSSDHCPNSQTIKKYRFNRWLVEMQYESTKRLVNKRMNSEYSLKKESLSIWHKLLYYYTLLTWHFLRSDIVNFRSIYILMKWQNIYIYLNSNNRNTHW